MRFPQYDKSLRFPDDDETPGGNKHTEVSVLCTKCGKPTSCLADESQGSHWCDDCWLEDEEKPKNPMPREDR